ncbi:MAG: enoyl-CoA hydratase [Gammaproteobacteria bacterium 39-13]|nr:bifunctional enoyl-CoA hydratase/phosphate acetyltransferase [Gammaproteobacteria bacterium]OJV94377.1 MAG: enoyl-CoA hydratase [Gammaproteobacteria bacterium 39-13]
MTDYIENKTFDEIKIGDSAMIKHTFKKEDIELFASVTGDVNPAHVDPEFAKNDMFHKIIAHGMWGGALISSVLGTELPGPGTIYLDQSLKFEYPVSIGDTIIASVTVTGKKPEKHIVELECKCTNQSGKQVISGKAIVIAPIEKVKRKRIELPKLVPKKPEGSWYHQLIGLRDDLDPITTAVVHPVDEPSLRGAIASAKDNLIIPILIGPEDKIRAVAQAIEVDLSAYEIIPTKHSHEAADKAVQLAKSGKVDALMKGKLHTDELMEAIIDKANGIRTGRRMSHIFAMDVQYYSKPLFISDAAINIRPTLAEKRDIVQNAIDLFIGLGFGTPKVAIVCAVETVNESMPSTLDATALCKMAERGQITGGILDGPLGLDLAISEESAKVKGIYSSVAGNADIIIVPDLEAGNMLYKQMTYLSRMEAAGIVLGASVPIILTSRGSDELSRKASSAMALLYVRNKDKQLSLKP